MTRNEQRRPGGGGVSDTSTTKDQLKSSTPSTGRHQPRMVKLAELWERESARGLRYFSGFMGDAQVLLFDSGERDHPKRPGERVRVWKLMVQERDPSRRPGNGR